MLNPFSLISLTLLLSTTTALPALLQERAGATCGSVVYTAAQTNAASQKGYAYYKAGTTVSTYPHTYNNYEGFTFPVAGPYLEFPILASGALFTGGAPGADRVVITTAGKQAGTITHTGASGNNFVGCSGTS